MCGGVGTPRCTALSVKFPGSVRVTDLTSLWAMVFVVLSLGRDLDTQRGQVRLDQEHIQHSLQDLGMGIFGKGWDRFLSLEHPINRWLQVATWRSGPLSPMPS